MCRIPGYNILRTNPSVILLYRIKVFEILCPQYSFPIKDQGTFDNRILLFFLGGFYYQK